MELKAMNQTMRSMKAALIAVTMVLIAVVVLAAYPYSAAGTDGEWSSDPRRRQRGPHPERESRMTEGSIPERSTAARTSSGNLRPVSRRLPTA